MELSSADITKDKNINTQPEFVHALNSMKMPVIICHEKKAIHMDFMNIEFKYYGTLFYFAGENVIKT